MTTQTDIAYAARRLSDLLDLVTEAENYQWARPAPLPRHADDPGIRGQGGHSDPTADAAVDDSRLALREALKLTARDADALVKATNGLCNRLRAALSGYVSS